VIFGTHFLPQFIVQFLRIPDVDINKKYLADIRRLHLQAVELGLGDPHP